MSLGDDKGPINVTSTEKASEIRVVLQNADISQTKLSLEYPGHVNYWRIKPKKTSGTLIVAFDLLDKIEESTQLEVLIRYGRPPTSINYNVRLKIQWNSQVDDAIDKQKLASLGMDSSNVHCRIIDDKSFICHYNSTLNDTVWFSAKYDGTMPSNKQTWNFTSSIHEPECLFWNETINMFDGTGVEVCSRIMMPSIFLLRKNCNKATISGIFRPNASIC